MVKYRILLFLFKIHPFSIYTVTSICLYRTSIVDINECPFTRSFFFLNMILQFNHQMVVKTLENWCCGIFYYSTTHPRRLRACLCNIFLQKSGRYFSCVWCGPIPRKCFPSLSAFSLRMLEIGFLWRGIGNGVPRKTSSFPHSLPFQPKTLHSYIFISLK